MNKNKIKIRVDSLHKLLSIPLKMAQFPVKLSPEFVFHKECYSRGYQSCDRDMPAGWSGRKPGVVGPLFSFLINYITCII